MRRTVLSIDRVVVRGTRSIDERAFALALQHELATSLRSGDRRGDACQTAWDPGRNAARELAGRIAKVLRK